VLRNRRLFKYLTDSGHCKEPHAHLKLTKRLDILNYFDVMKIFNHIGIPTNEEKQDEIHLPYLKMYVTDHEKSPNGIQWMRFEDGAPYPELVLTVPHIAFEVDDLAKAIEGQKVIIEPNSPSEGLIVAFIEDCGAPVEFMQYDRKLRKE
jgi:hypothetical protein